MKSILTCALALALGTGVAFGLSGCKKEEKKPADTGSAAAPSADKMEKAPAAEPAKPAEEKK
jgi:hypothetical protein